MNLPADIIMCSPLAMNLPAHDPSKHLLVQVSNYNIQHVIKKKLLPPALSFGAA